MPDQPDSTQPEVQPSEHETVEIKVPASHRYLSILTECIEQMLVNSEIPPGSLNEIYKIKLAANEICANIVDHAYEQTAQAEAHILIRLTLYQSPARFTVEFFDQGKPFNEGRIRIPDLQNPQEDGGLGMYLAHKIMDQVHYEQRDASNYWLLSKNLS